MTLGIESFWNIVGKGGNAGNQHFLLTHNSFVTFISGSTYAFNMVKFCCFVKSYWKQVQCFLIHWKLFLIRIFSFCHNGFYTSHANFQRSSYIHLIILKGIQFDWLIDCIVFNAVFNSISVIYRSGQGTYPCFPGVPSTSILHNILTKSLAAFPRNHSRNNRQRWERNESCRSDYHQSLQWWILVNIKNIGRAGDRTSDLLFSSLQPYRLSYGAQFELV